MKKQKIKACTSCKQTPDIHVKACTSCKQTPDIHKHSIDGSVYWNLVCHCKKTPLERCSLGPNTSKWNKKWFKMDSKELNKKSGYETGEGISKEFHYFT